jgi:hypothetical protein
MLAEPLAVTLQVIDALDMLNVPYWIGGSLAVAVHGVARSTLDTDLVADLRIEQAELFAGTLEPAFYLDIEMIMDAISRQSSFNIIHRETMFKVDIFILKDRAFDQSQLIRREKQIVTIEPERTADVCTPEDLLLVKLEWFRMGGEVSERQWRDVLGVLKAQSGKLDIAYLRRWAGELNIADLLDRAFAEATAAN